MGFVTGRTLSLQIMRIFNKEIHPRSITRYRHEMGKFNQNTYNLIIVQTSCFFLPRL
jgi:hypothetical protein